MMESQQGLDDLSALAATSCVTMMGARVRGMVFYADPATKGIYIYTARQAALQTNVTCREITRWPCRRRSGKILENIAFLGFSHRVMPILRI